uniref:hypothetical protein n=1 Tax=Corallococcus coralloides TaxID=184914 RepID=UPI00320497C1
MPAASVARSGVSPLGTTRSTTAPVSEGKASAKSCNSSDITATRSSAGRSWSSRCR